MPSPRRNHRDRSRSPPPRSDRDSCRPRHSNRGRPRYFEPHSPPRDEFGRSRPPADSHSQRQEHRRDDRTHERHGRPSRFDSDGQGRRGPPDAEFLAARQAQRKAKWFSIWPASPTASADEEDRIEEERVIAKLQGKPEGEGDGASSAASFSVKAPSLTVEASPIQTEAP
ncbi:hypothetical protein H4R19_004350 [Coemansia spiralis]|nr:hypothetical protein H4R19_004350 [Coemansia spiralis]